MAANEVWLNKRKAAALLGKAVRTFDNIAAAAVADGRLRKKVLPPGKGRNYSEALFLESDVRRLADTGVRSHTPKALTGPVSPDLIAPLVHVLDTLADRLVLTALPPETKYFLSIDEAARLLGMPARWVRQQIKAGRLTAERGPKGAYRLRKTHVEALGRGES